MRRSRWPIVATFFACTAIGGTLRAQQAPPVSPEQKAANAARRTSALADTLAGGASFPAQRRFNHNGKISTNFDRFKNLTTITGELFGGGFMNASTLAGDVSFGYRGKSLSAPPRFVLFTFRTTWPDDYRFLKDHEVQFIVDDSIPIDAGETLYDADVATDAVGVRVHEQTTAILPVAQFLQLVHGKKVELRLGGEGPAREQRTLKEDQLELLRDLASRMAVAKPGT